MLRLNLLLQSGDAHLEKLVEIGTDNAEKFQTFQQGIRLVECLIENPLVKFEPAKPPIDEERGIIEFHGVSTMRWIFSGSREHL